MRIFVAFCVALLLASCSRSGRVFPLNDAALQAGTPTVEYVAQGLGHGPIKITMPDGEILTGEYQITENAAVGMAFAGGHMATAVAAGGGRPVVANAVGNRGTIFNCEGALGIGGHGSLICNDNKGRNYRLMI